MSQILEEATLLNASDLHFEAHSHGYQIRLRIDGLLQLMQSPENLTRSKMPAVCSRIKLLAGLDVAEYRKPQDGRFHYQTQHGVKRDCRVSICPTTHGEKIVIRLLNPQQHHYSLQDLGMNSVQQLCVEQAIAQPQGFILVTGPTGSGKSMTLYTLLRQLNGLEHNIMTIEDPVELQLPGINQVNINHAAQLNFAAALRCFLRQDPDIIMIGEIRDSETAEIALKAAQTGHLVLASLHTNGAVETWQRLIHLGIAEHYLQDTLNLVIAQRLIRKLCPHCKTPYSRYEKPTQRDTVLCSPPTNSPTTNSNKLITGTLYQAQGCKHCHNGYRGRAGVYEMLVCRTHGARPALLNQHTLWDNGMEKVHAGITTLEEIERAVGH